jgi:hypothetical protein
MSTELLKALFDHPAMEPNREQTFMTPANKKTKPYFMWDFVGRTLGTLYAIPADLPDNIKNEEDGIWQDVMGMFWSLHLLSFGYVGMDTNVRREGDLCGTADHGAG